MENHLIIGASSGIGKTLAESRAKSGHTFFTTFFKQPLETEIKGLSYHLPDIIEDNPKLTIEFKF